MEALNSCIMWKDHLYEITVFILPPFALASIFSLIWSGASLLSLCCPIFSAYRKPIKNKCLSVLIYLWISKNLVVRGLSDCNFLSFACFLLFLIQTYPVSTSCYSETGAKGREMQEHWVNCQEPNSLFWGYFL